MEAKHQNLQKRRFSIIIDLRLDMQIRAGNRGFIMADQKADEIKAKDLEESSAKSPSKKKEEKDDLAEYQELNKIDQEPHDELGIEDDLIPTESDPFDDFNISEDFDYENNAETKLETTEVSDAIEPQAPTEPELDIPVDENRDFKEKIPTEPDSKDISSTDKLYVMPDETVSSSERDELLSNLQKKIPNIMKQKQDIEEPSEPSLDEKPSKDELKKAWKKQVQEELAEPKPKPEPETEILPIPPSSNQESFNESVAEFNGSRVYLPSTMKVKAGDEIIVRGRKFRAKKKSFDRRRPLLIAVLGIVVVLGLAFIASRFFVQAQPGMVVGQVINSQSGEVIPEAQVIIDELGETVFSNANGMFVIDNLSDGDWSVSASKPQYKSAAIGFSHGGGKPSVLTLSLEPSIPVKEEKEDKNDEKKIKEVRIPNYGKLTVITNTPKSKIIVDNKMLGTGNKTYSKITVGKHKLVVMAEGYKEYSGQVEIKRNENNKFTIDLQELKAEYKPSEISFEDYLVKADAMASKGDWTEAIGNYTLALAKREDGDTYHKRSTAFLQTGQKSQAISDLVRASKAYTNQGRVNRAIECLNEILDLEPKNTTAYRERGFANLRLGNFEKAIDDLKEAVDIDDDDFDNHMALGEAYYIMGKHKDALKYLKKARKIDDNNARVYALSALASLARDDEGDAEKYFKGFEIRASIHDREEFERDPDWQRLSDMMSQLDD